LIMTRRLARSSPPRPGR